MEANNGVNTPFERKGFQLRLQFDGEETGPLFSPGLSSLIHPFMRTLFKTKEACGMRLFKQAKAGLFLLTFTWGLILLPVHGQVTPGSGNSGTTNSPPSGNYPGSGSSPQPGVPPPSIAPSGPTPGSGQGGTTNTPPNGITPGSGTSPAPTH
jgi:hypothetical protein